MLSHPGEKDTSWQAFGGPLKTDLIESYGLLYSTIIVSGLRLIGLAGQGSTPWTTAGLIALLVFVISFIRKDDVTLSGHSDNTEEVPMKKAQILKAGYCILNTVWAIGTSVVAAPLST
jgi:hypothetical protein